MNKDVIYIDIEDDITAIIGKVKQAGSKIVALVPPKRAGVLQSAVNLKLLQKAAESADKRVVLITNDHSLTSLAAGVAMPVAKNLQSRPEVPTLPEQHSDDEEIINGAELPVGEVAESLGGSQKPRQTLADSVSDKVDLTDIPTPGGAPSPMAGAMPPPVKAPPKKPLALLGKKSGGKLRVPDFATFRNKFFLFGGIGVILVAFLVWAFVFAPHAKVTISAQTTAVNGDKTLTLDTKAASSDPDKLTLKPNVQQLKKSAVTQFTATGTKDVGNKASGTITVYNCDNPSAFQLSSGTVFTANGGRKFTSNGTVTVPALAGSASACSNSSSHVGAGQVDVAVTAVDLGDEYNVPAGGFTISGISGDIFARSAAAMAGGSHQMATVVSQEDVDKAKGQLTQPNVNEAKNELKKQFKGDYITIEESFTADEGQPAVEPAVGQPAQQAKVTVETIFTLVAIERNDVKNVLTNVVNEALKDKSSLQLYSLGDNSIKFQTFQKLENGNYSARMVTASFIGPKIDTKSLAQQISGKRFGEIDALINQIPGVNKVDVDFSPFWVTTAPNADKIEISFSVENGD